MRTVLILKKGEVDEKAVEGADETHHFAMDWIGIACLGTPIPRAFITTELTIGIEGDREGCFGSQAENTDPE